MFKLFKRRKAKKEISIQDNNNQVFGNSAEMLRKIYEENALCVAKYFHPDIKIEELNEEDLEFFSDLWLLLFLISHGIHASEEDIENLKMNGQL